MSRNRVWLFGVVLSLGILLLAMPATAWEFTMKGSYVWQYGYRSQMGNEGFFGPYDVDFSTARNLHAVNAWLGTHSNNLQFFQGVTPAGFTGVFNPAEILVSGHDGGWNTMWMDCWMDLRVNPAVRVRGLYHIGEWAGTTGTQNTSGFLQGEGALVQSQYQNFRFPGVQRSFSPGYWNLLWLTAQLPWGDFAIGKRPSAFGTGLMWNGEDSRTSENFALFASYGPLRIGGGFYWGRAGSEGYVTDPFDKSGFRIYDITFPAITYRNGPLDAGMQFLYLQRHRGGDRRNQGPPPLTTKNTDFRDRADFYGAVYTKYNNGRFFFNAELDWYDRIDRLGRQAFFNAADPDTSSDLYIQHYRFMTELGLLCGPTKMSLLYSWSSGNDRRGGIANYTTSGGIPNINQGTLVEPTNGVTGGLVASTTASNTGVYRPYSYLMVYAYGLGTHIEGDTGNGYVEDASCYAARFDYAVASNLNLYGSFFWADRVGNAYGWGFLKPATVVAAAAPNANAFPAVNGIVSGYVAGAPTIPDNNLGWEVDAGFDWKLLEGLTLNATFAYWQPGRWFSYACIDKGVLNWNTQTAANNFGTDPSRTITPIFGIDFKVVGDF